MRVLQLVHNQEGTGPYPKVLEQAKALGELGAQVTLVCTSPVARTHVTETVEDGVRVVRAPDLLWGRLRQGVDPWNTVRRIGVAMSGTFDIVHGIDARPVVIVPALWRKLAAGTPLVLSWWDMFGAGGTARERWGAVYGRTLGMLEGKWESAFRRYADRATVISTSLATRLEALGYPPERILLQRVGCDTRRHAPGDKLSARRELGLAADATILCYVGALLQRDRRLLEEALRLLATRYERELSVLMVGTPVGGFRGAGGVRVQWVERQPLDGVYRYLAASDLCLLPLCESAANRARWPSKVADYFNAGRPVVATKVSDLEQLYATYSLGYLADRSTPEGYAEALLRALESRPEWDEVGRSARRFAELHLDTRVLGNELLALYADAQRANS